MLKNHETPTAHAENEEGQMMTSHRILNERNNAGSRRKRFAQQSICSTISHTCPNRHLLHSTPPNYHATYTQTPLSTTSTATLGAYNSHCILLERILLRLRSAFHLPCVWVLPTAISAVVAAANAPKNQHECQNRGRARSVHGGFGNGRAGQW